MTDALDIVRKALSSSPYIGQVSGGFVPLPERRQDGGQIFIVNCEYLSSVRSQLPDQLLRMARTDTATIIREIPIVKFDDTSSISVRFGFYEGARLAETVYVCTLPTSFLKESQQVKEFYYWNYSFDVPYRIEDSGIPEIQTLLDFRTI